MPNTTHLIGFILREQLKETLSVQRKARKNDDDVLKEKHTKNWIAKEIKEEVELASILFAFMEVASQEVFRLIYPCQPKTRLKCSAGKYYVLSEEIKGKPLTSRPEVKEKIRIRKYKNFGRLCMLALFCNEVDFKLSKPGQSEASNIFVDEQGNILKIDGGWCFGATKSPEDFGFQSNITLLDFESLPFVFYYNAYNWLDIIRPHKFASWLNDELTHAELLLKKPIIEDEKNRIHLLLSSLDEKIIDRCEIQLFLQKGELTRRCETLKYELKKCFNVEEYNIDPAKSQKSAMLEKIFKSNFEEFLADDTYQITVRDVASKIVDRTLSLDEQYRLEVNETALALLLLPAELINQLFENIIDRKLFLEELQKSGIDIKIIEDFIANRFPKVIKDRQINLHQEVMQSRSFLEYLKSEQAKIFCEKLITQFADFKIKGKKKFTYDFPSTMQAKLIALVDEGNLVYANLKPPILPQPQTTPVSTAAPSSPAANDSPFSSPDENWNNPFDNVPAFTR